MYRIGIADPFGDVFEEEYEDQEEAEIAAIESSYSDDVIAVTDGENIVSLVFQQVIYRP